MSARVEAALLELAAAVREEIAAIPEGVGTLGEEIARARAVSRLSLQEVGERSGFTKSHIWELEKGRARNPTVGMIAGVSAALGVPFHRLAEAALNTLRERTPPMTANNTPMTEEREAVERLTQAVKNESWHWGGASAPCVDVRVPDLQAALDALEARATSADAEAASYKAEAASEFLKRQEVKARLAEAVGLLTQVQTVLSMCIDPEKIGSTTVQQAWALCVSNEAKVRAFLSRQEGASQ